MRDICDRVANGEPLTRVLKLEGMPAPSTFWRWISANPDAARLWEQARENAGHTLAHRVSDIAEDVRTGKLEPDAARVILNAYQWAAGKFTPRHYSDRFAQLGGLQLVINTTLDLASDQRGQDLTQPGTYTLSASLPDPDAGEGEPPFGSHQVPDKRRGSHRIGRKRPREKLQTPEKQSKRKG